MSLKAFYPKAYIVPVANKIVFATTDDQTKLTTALSSNWIELRGTEAKAIMEETAGQKVELTTGDELEISMNSSQKLNFLQVTPANYAALRALKNTECAILFNEIYADGTGFATQILCTPEILPEGGNGKLLRIIIDSKTEAAATTIETINLPAGT